MNKEQERVHKACKRLYLPPGWRCKVAWPWGNGTHLVRPEGDGGIIVRDRYCTAQLPSDGITAECIYLQDGVNPLRYEGRGWVQRIVEAAGCAAWSYPLLEELCDGNRYVDFRALRSIPSVTAWERLELSNFGN